MLRPLRANAYPVTDPDLVALVLAAQAGSRSYDTYGDRATPRFDVLHRYYAVLRAAWAEQVRRNSSRSPQ